MVCMNIVSCPIMRENGNEDFHLNNINGIIIDDLKNVIYSFSREKQFKVWKKENLQLKATVSGHSDPIIRWSVDINTNTLTTYAETEIIIWNMDQIKMIDTIIINHGVISQYSFYDSKKNILVSQESNGKFFFYNYSIFQTTV